MISHLATGGMAQIYLARQTGLGSFERHVVLKTILRERASDQRFVNMFLDEAKLAATLNHQNVAQVYEVDQADGAYFMAMEYVHGENARAILETSLRRGWTIPLELAVMIVSGAGAGLHHAHERKGKGGQPLNIVHRDVSPANIMVGYDGAVKVLDFGIAKAEERATKTVGGTIKGKYGYMAPEQCKGKPIDRRSDIFALGICLYELTTLRRAFKGNDDFETMKRIVAGDVVLPSVAVSGYPRELEAIILTAMANDPNQRFQTAQELIEALDAFTVRAKLTGSNTAMGRFMEQLFGSRKEPWVEGAQQHERTEITDDVDNEKTNVVQPSHEMVRMASAPGHAMQPTQPAPVNVEWQAEQERGGRALPSNRQTPRSFDAPPPPAIRPTPVPQIGPPQTFLAHEEISDIGAQPLIEDSKLGWETSPANKQIRPSAHPGATRLSTQATEDYKIKSSTRWLVLAILLVVLTGAAVAAIGLEWVSF
ncbi:MAG: serine/threonine protein kinase [Deltaproteobacteria bacterium]|nr:serine/threonine protein kinase [Deltaproteobacteria bacterium]